MLKTNINKIFLLQDNIKYWKLQKQYLTNHNDRLFYILNISNEDIVKLENIIDFKKFKKDIIEKCNFSEIPNYVFYFNLLDVLEEDELFYIKLKYPELMEE